MEMSSEFLAKLQSLHGSLANCERPSMEVLGRCWIARSPVQVNLSNASLFARLKCFFN
jgi:hypothetical protein